MKTFYSVEYRCWGADMTYTKWFDNKDDAWKFYNQHNYVDKPVCHNFKNPDKIQAMENIIALSI